jgi:hypothetical protein
MVPIQADEGILRHITSAKQLRPRTGFAAAILVGALAAAPALGQSVVNAPKVGGYLQVRETAQEQVGLSATLNRVRVSADGALPSKFAYRVLVEYQAPAGARVPRR